jgi:hypothetical protein
VPTVVPGRPPPVLPQLPPPYLVSPFLFVHAGIRPASRSPIRTPRTSSGSARSFFHARTALPYTVVFGHTPNTRCAHRAAVSHRSRYRPRVREQAELPRRRGPATRTSRARRSPRDDPRPRTCVRRRALVGVDRCR